ncbi:MAG TPA: hypothetical protein VI278_17390 [Nitrososphaeraceae archaeon]
MPELVPFGSADAEIIIFPVIPNNNAKEKNKAIRDDNRLVKANFFTNIF